MNFEKVFHSFGTPLSNSMEERQWRKMIHRGTYVKHRDQRTDQQCRICKSENETIVHLFRCHMVKPFWKQCLQFCYKALHTRVPTLIDAAIIFGLWKRDTLGPMPARAFLRHAFSHLYRHMCYVDLKKYTFVWERAYRDTVAAFQDACLRYARRLQLLHNRRKHTRIDSAPKDAYTSFESFMSIDFPDGSTCFSDEFKTEISRSHTLAQTRPNSH